ncbi:glutamate ligase domain-containing protein [Deinococcus multiflagellatus]|uniref:Glutamate ligase domain-containing protein n=1 Tax=Deinococcus multiflagellatus TaxID=1656887 RepID=A0ABW1ZJC4_9DEIO
MQNALAAAAIAAAQNVDLSVIRSALGSFSTSFAQSPGRLNLYDGHPFRVLLDYAHNPSGLEYLSELVSHLRPPKGRVIGVMGVAGDRRDEDIVRMGEIAANTFDHLIIREDELRRGRRVGEGAALVQQGARRAGAEPERLTTILNEAESVECALRLAQPGDLVILLATEVEDTWQQILDFDSSHIPRGALPQPASQGQGASHD